MAVSMEYAPSRMAPPAKNGPCSAVKGVYQEENNPFLISGYYNPAYHRRTGVGRRAEGGRVDNEAKTAAFFQHLISLSSD